MKKSEAPKPNSGMEIPDYAIESLARSLLPVMQAYYESEEGQKATAKMRSFMSGGDMFAQGEISKEMSRFLRLLT